MLIDTRLAERIKNIHPSTTLAITSKAKRLKSEGKDVVNLAAGEPDFDTPGFIKQAAIEAIQKGCTKYTPSTGIPDLKKLIIEKFKRDNALTYEPAQIVVSCGAKHSIFNTLLCLINKNDEVLIPEPYWVSYPEMVRVCEAKPRFIKTSADQDFKITPDSLNRHITTKTKALILNSPSNPTGCVYSKEELVEIARICVEKKIFVISDEIYENLIYDGLRHISIAALGEDIYNFTVTVNGLSKSHSMTGWRIGFLGAPLPIAEAISNLQDHSTSNPCSISQYAAVAALSTQDDFIRQMLGEFQKRRDYVISRLQGMEKLSVVIPRGAFYVFCGIKKTKLDSQTFASRLLEESLVALIPGDGFGRNDHIRLSFATSMEQLAKGLDRLNNWLKNI